METARQSPSGPFQPIARLSISAPVAFTTTVLKAVPFDVVDFLKGDIGRIQADIPGRPFAIGPGLYLVQAQFVLSVSQTTILASIGVADGSSSLTSAVQSSGNTRCAISGNFLLPPADLPLDPGNDIFAALGLDITATGGSGNINNCQLLISKLAFAGAGA